MEEHHEPHEDQKTYNFAYEILVSVLLIIYYVENRSKRMWSSFKIKTNTIFILMANFDTLYNFSI